MEILSTINFSKLHEWDIKRTKSVVHFFRYPQCRLSKVLSKADVEWVNIEDDKEYPLLGVHAHGEGVYINKIAKGKELTMRAYQKSQSYLLFYCKVRTVNGQWGIVYPQFEDSYGSSNMQYLKIEQDLLSPIFLENLLKIKRLTKEWDKNAIGANGRHFPLKTLLSLEIPLPTRKQQDGIVAKYNQTIAEAKTKEDQARQLENEIEKYMFKALGIYLDNRRTFTNKTLQIIRYSNLDRWDAYGTDNSFSAALKKSDYPITPIGKVFDFITRTWDKIEPTFKYVEIGSVDPLLGIVHTEEIETKKAPSRATQIIRKGDLILGTTRPYLKKFAIVDGQHDGHICSSGFQVIAPNKDTNVEFLYEYLKSSIAIAQFEFYMTGALYPAITIKDLKKILIPLPPIGIQNSIVEHINEMKSQIKLLKQQAADLRAQALKDFEKEIFEY